MSRTESALGAASHMGRRDIAELLIALRAQLEQVLARKIEQPDADLTADGAALIEGVIGLVATGGRATAC